MAIEYYPSSSKTRLDEIAASGVERILDQTDGDVLVFLPGVGEIRQTQKQSRTRGQDTQPAAYASLW